MALTKAMLVQRLASLARSDETEAALKLLQQSDLPQIVPSGDQSHWSPAEDWLRIYKLRHESTTEAGIATVGFLALLAALRELYPSTPLTITTFASEKWYGTFWSDEADRLIGFVLVERRSPQHEQERLDWFRKNLT